MKNIDRRPREHLTPAEVERLAAAAKKRGRHGHRDATMIRSGNIHGFRVSELVDLRWSQIDFDAAIMHVRRLKNGTPSTHPIPGAELRALRRLRRDYPEGPYVFVSERGGPLSPSAFAKIIARAGEAAGLELALHPHMLRHACGYKLANDGVDTRTIQSYLGHRNIQHTVRYTELASRRSDELWE